MNQQQLVIDHFNRMDEEPSLAITDNNQNGPGKIILNIGGGNADRSSGSSGDVSKVA